jgi:hypothetical protein
MALPTFKKKETTMRSKFEKDISNVLKRNKVKFKYETLSLTYTVQRKYKPDFICGDIIIEAKGRFTGADRTKLLKIKETYPNLDIRLWFMYDNWLTNKKQSRYSDWAKKHGFLYHVGLKFPKKWFG